MLMSQIKQKNIESDSSYFLKLVLYVILGSIWLRFEDPLVVGELLIGGIPVGLLVGLLFAAHDHFQVDRKIEYAILLIMTILTMFIPAVSIMV